MSNYPATEHFIVKNKLKECYGIKWPQGTEVIVICHDEDREQVAQDVEKRGYKIALFMSPDPGFMPIGKGQYIMRQKPEPVRWNPREWEGERIWRMRQELLEKGIEL